MIFSIFAVTITSKGDGGHSELIFGLYLATEKKKVCGLTTFTMIVLASRFSTGNGKPLQGDLV
jgi:hypothetical protein